MGPRQGGASTRSDVILGEGMRAVARFSSGLLVLLGALSWPTGCSDSAVKGPGEDKEEVQDATAADTGAPTDAALDVAADTGFARVGKCKAGPASCDDDNPCTIDGCDPNTGCYSTPKACGDDDPCTLDTCDLASGACKHAPETCDDGNKCTTGKCVPGEGCTHTATDCDDGDACTSDGCSPQVGCNNDPLDCDDGQACTADSCDKETGCAHVKPEGALCCKHVGDCEDDNVCTIHACNEGICETAGVFGCCAADADCDDGNDCTVDGCDKGSGLCANVFQAGPGCCLIDTECDDKDACTLDRCVGAKCAHETQCCEAAKSCDPGGALGLCAEATCTAAGCATAYKGGTDCCAGTPAQTGFEVNEKWTPALVPSVKGIWIIDDKASVSAGTSKYGSGALQYVASAKPVAGGQDSGRAVFDEVELPAGTQVGLTFYVRSSLLMGSAGDRFTLRVATSMGTWVVWQAGGSAATWQKVEVDLSGFAARPATRKVRLFFDLIPSKLTVASTWVRLDDVALSSSCAPRTCTADAGCDDGLAATAEVCSEGVCVYKSHPKYCEDNAACNDNDKCTTDVCTNLLCVQTAIPNCCISSAECPDENPCTTDYCSGNQCKHLLSKPAPQCCFKADECDDGNSCTIDTCPSVGLACAYTKTAPDCCAGNADCDDGDKCTADICLDQKCTHKNQCCKTAADCDDGDPKCTEDKCTDEGMCAWLPTGATGCCDNDIFGRDFEDGSVAGLELKNSAPATSKWQVVTGKKAKSGKGALYYGNLAKGNFDDGATNGTVTTEDIALPVGEKLTLSFALWMDSETSTTYDKFEVWVLAGAKKIKVWNKGLVTGGFQTKVWMALQVDLSAFGGQQVKLQFLFDTTDPIANDGEGVYLDDISLKRTCAKLTCGADADCDDKLKESTDKCVSGACSYTLL